jgi:hypothetical protein
MFNSFYWDNTNFYGIGKMETSKKCIIKAKGPTASLSVNDKNYILKKNDKSSGSTSEVYVSTDKELVLKKVKNFLKYSVYEREKYILTFLNTMKVDWCPKLIQYDDDNKILVMTYCGERINGSNKPTTFIKQFADIMHDLSVFKLKHNDIKEVELLVLNDKLYLCDFGWCSMNNHLSCEIGLWEGKKPNNYHTDETVYQRLKHLF